MCGYEGAYEKLDVVVGVSWLKYMPAPWSTSNRSGRITKKPKKPRKKQAHHMSAEMALQNNQWISKGNRRIGLSRDRRSCILRREASGGNRSLPPLIHATCRPHAFIGLLCCVRRGGLLCLDWPCTFCLLQRDEPRSCCAIVWRTDADFTKSIDFTLTDDLQNTRGLMTRPLKILSKPGTRASQFRAPTYARPQRQEGPRV